MNRKKELEELIVELKRQKKNIQTKIWYLNNKDKWKEKYKKWNKNYRDKNIEKEKERHKKYNKTEEGKKAIKKGCWKSRGLNMDNFEEIYKKYVETTNCNICNVLLTIDKKTMKPTTKCMDHSHLTGEFRNILCCACNNRRGENNL